MKNYHFKVHITLEDGSTDSAVSFYISDMVYFLGECLRDFRIVHWKILKVPYLDDLGTTETILHSEM